MRQIRHVMLTALRRHAGILAIATAGVVAPALARADQAPAPVPAPSDTVQTSGAAPPQLNRIREALNQEPALDLNDQQLRFYLEIIAKQPKFSDFVKGYDFINGPTKRGSPMTHQEFVNLVTPKELYGSGGIKAHELLQFALTSWLGKALVERALEDLKNARDEREMQAIRDRIDHELAILRGDASNSR